MAFTGNPVDLGVASYETAAIPFNGNVIVLGSLASTALTKINLVRLNPRITGLQSGIGRANLDQFIDRNINEDKRQIEKTVNAVIDAVDEINRALAEAAAAKAEAQEAKNEADAVAREQALRDSYIDPSNALTAANDGTVSIAAHNRIYVNTDGTETVVSVDAGSITGQFGLVYVSYTDVMRGGGAVTYEASSTQPTQAGDTHVVGAVTVPDAGAPPSTGGGPNPPGYIDIGDVLP